MGGGSTSGYSISAVLFSSDLFLLCLCPSKVGGFSGTSCISVIIICVQDPTNRTFSFSLNPDFLFFSYTSVTGEDELSSESVDA